MSDLALQLATQISDLVVNDGCNLKECVEQGQFLMEHTKEKMQRKKMQKCRRFYTGALYAMFGDW